MSVIEDLVLAFQTRGTREAAAETDVVASSVRKTDEAAKTATVSHDKLSKSFGGLKNMAQSAAGTLGVAGLAFGIAGAIKSASQFQETQAQLGASIRANVHAPARDATAQMSDFADSLSTHGGFAAAQAIQGMTQFLRVTKDVHKSESDMTLATNIARGAHVDLSRAVRSVMMLEQGRTTGLSRLGIVVTKSTMAVNELHATYKKVTPEQLAAAKATDALATKQAAMAQVSRQYGGAMATYSHTSAGGINNLRNSFEVLSVHFGQLFLPLVTKAGELIGKLVKPLSDVLSVVKALMPLILALGGAWAAYNVITTIVEIKTALMSAALWGNVTAALALIPEIGSVSDAWVVLNGVMDTNPILLVVTALALLVVGFIEAYKHVKWFRELVNALGRDAGVAFGWIKHAAVDAFDWMKAHWPLLVAVFAAPLLPLLMLVTHFGDVKKVATDVVNWVVREFNRMLSFISGLPGKVASLLAHLWDGLLSGLKDMPKKVLGALEKIPIVGGAIKAGAGAVSSLVHGVGSALSGVLQGGGPVTRSGAYLVGERGPEVVNLPGGAYITSNDRLTAGMEQVVHAITAMAQRPIVVYNIVDGKVLSQSIMRQGLLQQSRGG